ncbi:MAG: hypothetical protein J0H73_14320 [Salana multivorans]|uniref:hypothetical protein n=1 Tax=Salana multivorans TaxID=120377 RepID=UPI00095B99A3|nr:hypothetical protein [Salana multivorans]MBN8883476.1 hypothetical protein [Salana multivorans]OJX98665.1 MAG: hypothetical protein BGO96_04615 [Micrococcales bacterium 73-15]
MTRPSAHYIPATSVIDPTAPGGVEALLAFHHTTFGDARMDAGSGEEPAGGTGATGGGDGEQPGATPTSGTTATPPGSEAENVDQLPAWAQKLIRDTRAEAANHRTKANDATAAQQQTLDTIATALGLKKDDGQAPTVESLTEQLTTATASTQQAQTDARAARVELAVYRAATGHSADPAALLDSRAFLAKLADLDPADADFQTKIDAAIKAAVDTNPKLKTVQVAARSGNDLTGGTGETRTRTPKSLTDAVATAYSHGAQ